MYRNITVCKLSDSKEVIEKYPIGGYNWQCGYSEFHDNYRFQCVHSFEFNGWPRYCYSSIGARSKYDGMVHQTLEIFISEISSNRLGIFLDCYTSHDFAGTGYSFTAQAISENFYQNPQVYKKESSFTVLESPISDELFYNFLYAMHHKESLKISTDDHQTILGIIEHTYPMLFF